MLDYNKSSCGTRSNRSIEWLNRGLGASWRDWSVVYSSTTSSSSLSLFSLRVLLILNNMCRTQGAHQHARDLRRITGRQNASTNTVSAFTSSINSQTHLSLFLAGNSDFPGTGCISASPPCCTSAGSSCWGLSALSPPCSASHGSPWPSHSSKTNSNGFHS